jgi:tungstate transport system ATP-binding protein
VSGERPPLFEVQGLRVARGGVEVLDVPALRLGEGEFVSLIGPNGSGKTTLLLALMGLLPRSAGRVLWRGREIATDAERLALRRRVAMVLQEPLLFDTTVYENVASGLRLRHLDRGETRRRTLACLERFGLAAMADRAARKLSGGEARRVSVARALAVAPDAIFLDEPFANLDAPTREAIAEDMRRAVSDAGVAAVLVTHDAFEALRVSERIVVMHGGRVVQDDRPAVVMNEPANAFVAACVGMESIVEGVVVKSAGGELEIAAGGARIEALGDAPPGSAVYCCVRPESVTIEEAQPGHATSARNLFPARVASLASMGAYVKVGLDCGFRLVSSVTADSFTALALAVGRPVFASFKATAVHVIRRDARAPISADSGPR